MVLNIALQNGRRKVPMSYSSFKVRAEEDLKHLKRNAFCVSFRSCSREYCWCGKNGRIQ